MRMKCNFLTSQQDSSAGSAYLILRKGMKPYNILLLFETNNENPSDYGNR